MKISPHPPHVQSMHAEKRSAVSNLYTRYHTLYNLPNSCLAYHTLYR